MPSCKSESIALTALAGILRVYSGNPKARLDGWVGVLLERLRQKWIICSVFGDIIITIIVATNVIYCSSVASSNRLGYTRGEVLQALRYYAPIPDLKASDTDPAHSYYQDTTSIIS